MVILFSGCVLALFEQLKTEKENNMNKRFLKLKSCPLQLRPMAQHC